MFCSSVVLVLLASSPAWAKEEECPNAVSVSDDSEALLLLQMEKGRRVVDGLPDHIVCHTQSCEEVQASLAVIKGKQQVAKQKLDECSKARKQLQSDLAAAAAKRAKAEKGLAKCAAERSALEKELRQCAEVDRPNAERALAQCAQERAKLEAELQQCATVDRPAAEKGLAQCAKDRALLEAKLKNLAELAAKGKLPAKISPKHRRRRRRSTKRSSSLIEEGSSEGDADMMTEEASLEEESLMKEQEQFQVALDEVDDRAEGFAKQLAVADALQSKIEAGMAKLDARQQKAQALLAKAEGKFGKIVAFMEDLGKDIAAAEQEVDSATAGAEQAASDLAAQQSEETAALTQLASLMQEEHQMLHDHVQEQRLVHEGRLDAQDVALNALMSKSNHDGGCDKARAEVITAKGNLELTAGALKACLLAKKEINAKIESVVALGEAASKGLQKCLDTKAELKIKIKQCHDRRDIARQKLQECLDRKKVLKEQIEKCHEKRDEAREKLKACLARKAELKTKINNLYKRSSLMQEGSAEHDELAQLEKSHAESEAELGMIMGTLTEESGKMAHIVQRLLALSDEEKQYVAGMSDATKDSDAATKDMADAEKEDAESERLCSSMGQGIVSALAEMRRVSQNLAGAVKANEASGKQVDKVEKAVSLLMERSL